jgi:hypothetical protein
LVVGVEEAAEEELEEVEEAEMEDEGADDDPEDWQTKALLISRGSLTLGCSDTHLFHQLILGFVAYKVLTVPRGTP